MSFKTTAAHSSRIKKPTRKPPSLRSSTSSSISSSAFSTFPRRKTASLSRSKSTSDKPRPRPSEDDENEDFFADRLDDLGLVQALTTDLTLRDVPQAMQYIQSRMFDPIPEQRSGMNSTRIAEVLNFRRRIPGVVSVGYVQVLLRSGTVVEREVRELVEKGAVRRVVVGVGGRRRERGGMGECLVLQREVVGLVEGCKELDEGVKGRFLRILNENPSALKVRKEQFEKEEDVLALVHAGFLTKALGEWTTTDVFSQPGDGSRGTLTSLNSISKAASGSLAAVGGEGALHAAGGSGGGVASRNQPASNESYSIAVPGIGAFLKLLETSRAHLTALVSKSRFREMPENLLRERWDGAGDDAGSEARRNRGEWAGVLPGKTRKWKLFWGVSFEWVLGECVGAGLLEVFDTGSVGRGVRIV